MQQISVCNRVRVYGFIIVNIVGMENCFVLGFDGEIWSIFVVKWGMCIY